MAPGDRRRGLSYFTITHEWNTVEPAGLIGVASVDTAADHGVAISKDRGGVPAECRSRPAGWRSVPKAVSIRE